jgi:hypothetical protein
MPDAKEQDPHRERNAVQREMQRRREVDEERESRELIDTVGEEQQRGRDRDRDREERED